MIVHPHQENASVVLTESALVKRGPGAISAISIYGGTAATGATVIIDDSIDGSGTDKWEIAAPQYGTGSISFPKPIPFSTGIYATITGTAPAVSIAYS